MSVDHISPCGPCAWGGWCQCTQCRHQRTTPAPRSCRTAWESLSCKSGQRQSDSWRINILKVDIWFNRKPCFLANSCAFPRELAPEQYHETILLHIERRRSKTSYPIAKPTAVMFAFMDCSAAVKSEQTRPAPRIPQRSRDICKM